MELKTVRNRITTDHPNLRKSLQSNQIFINSFYVSQCVDMNQPIL